MVMRSVAAFILAMNPFSCTSKATVALSVYTSAIASPG